MKCKNCGKTMIAATEVNKAVCNLQYEIDDTTFCFDCNVKETHKSRIREILSNPSGPSCEKCKRRGSEACVHERFGHLDVDDNCFTPGERVLSVRLDCSI